ncbi:hypothetical protein AAHN93_14090 [Vandammella animalimorsus]|uniref:hypothetical protein n=1 Tax=Vandammella animalimorsus TaxID=2029117 RepID=UPI0031B9E767
MHSNFSWPWAALIAIALTACGGGSDASDTTAPSPAPPPAPAPAPVPPGGLEVVLGNTALPQPYCQQPDIEGEGQRTQLAGTIDRMVFFDGQLLLLDNHYPQGMCPQPQQNSYIRRVRDGLPEALVRGGGYATAGQQYVIYGHAGGLYRDGSGQWHVLSHSDAMPMDNQWRMVDAQWPFGADAAQYLSHRNGPGIVAYDPAQSFVGLQRVAGETPPPPWGRPAITPRLQDGQGHAAAFYAPHALAVRHDGLKFFIDAGRLRTVDAALNVQTLDHASLGIRGALLDLTADAQGRIHALAQEGQGAYAWHRLDDGRVQRFAISDGMDATHASISATGTALYVALRQQSANLRDPWRVDWSSIYRVTPDGVQVVAGGPDIPQQAAQYLAQPRQYRLPSVRHIALSPDAQHLYIALPKAVLRLKLDGAAAGQP